MSAPVFTRTILSFRMSRTTMSRLWTMTKSLASCCHIVMASLFISLILVHRLSTSSMDMTFVTYRCGGKCTEHPWNLHQHAALHSSVYQCAVLALVPNKLS
jgi:hypothetical protein